MSKYDEELALFEDTRARVIYYSCIAEPKNILEISELWDYKTPTYFYQAKSKEVINEMKSKKLISTLKGARFQSNYDFLLEKKNINKFFEKTNNEISNAVIIEKYDYEITEGQLEDPLFKEFCIEKKPELKEVLNGIKIDSKETESFLSLWRAPLFKTVFLLGDCIKRLMGDRRDLPQNPQELLYSMMIKLCESTYFFKEGGTPDFPDPYLWLNIDEIFPLILPKLESAKSKLPEESKILNQRFKDVYEIMKNKFAIYEGRSEIGSYHLAKFVEIIEL